MSISAYLERLRNAVGHDLLIIPSTCIFLRDAQERVLLQQRSDTLEWGLPGGALELGENLEDAAVREMFEETGLKVKLVRLVAVYSDPKYSYYTYPNGDNIQAIINMFEARIVSGELSADGDETMDLAYFPIDSLPAGLSAQQRIRISDALSGRIETIVR